MTVNIDPSEVRSGASSTRPEPARRSRLPARAIAIGGLGGAGLIAFSVGAFSFFSTLADPRARTPRPMPAAASMPDLKDGMPVLVTSEPGGASAKTTGLNLPRPDSAERTPEPPPAERASIGEPSAPALRTGPTPPPIQNAATLPETRTVTPVAPPSRTAATIAPARAETIKAKPAQAPALASAAASVQEPVPEPTSTATAVAPASGQPARKPAAAKSPAQPPMQKTAARKPPATKAVADAAPAAAAAAEASAGSDDSEIPGARQFRAGVKALGGLFGGDSKDD